LLRPTKHIILLCLILAFFEQGRSQQIVEQNLKIKYDSLTGVLHINQKIILKNTSSKPVDTLFLLNWANAYHSKNTALAQSIIENYDLNFHFTRNKNRGYVEIDSVQQNHSAVDMIKVDDEVYRFDLVSSWLPQQTDTLQIHYQLKLPNAKFTGFGVDKQANILLENFYFQPVFNSQQIYRHKNIDDYPALPVFFSIELTGFPKDKQLFSNLARTNRQLEGKRKNAVVVITDQPYEHYKTGAIELYVPKKMNQVSVEDKKLSINRVIDFLNDFSGQFPNNIILITSKDFKDYKVYGPDLLPGFLNPFDDKFLWETEILHQISKKYVEQLNIDQRKSAWIPLGLASYFEYKYIDKFYPQLNILGKLSDKKLFRFFYASQVKMNEKYSWLYLYMARMNMDQSLTTSLDSLSNFNRNVSNPYKSALGLLMLERQIGFSDFRQKIKVFFQRAIARNTNEENFTKLFNTEDVHRNIWFKNYIKTRNKYDYKLKKLHQINDTSFQLKIKNKRQNAIPLTLFAVKNDSIFSFGDIPAFTGDTLLTLHTFLHPDFLGFNYYNNFPEIQIKNNYKKVNAKFLFSKSLQIRPYQDFDNPLKNQIFINPFFEYNYYDGIILGTQIYNESFLHNDLKYSISPSYSTKDHSLTGSFSVSNSHYFESFKPYAIKYGFNFKYYHYDHDLGYRRFNPYFVFKFRNKYLRKRQGSNLLFQHMYIDKDPGVISSESDNYSVFNVNYSWFDINIIKDLFYKTDLQLSDKFGKVSAMVRYRYLTNRNRQWDFRVFAGYFLYNYTTTDYFSFALDRPTDYLFQYRYYGRSESSGIFHQQFIWAEGGFKTFFDDQFANEFIISNNINIGIWKWFNIYGDWAWKKNRGEDVNFYYDSGLRINLVQDYFEIFFPVYSKLGWEISEPDYQERIRLVFTIDIKGLFKMVRRGWY